MDTSFLVSRIYKARYYQSATLLEAEYGSNPSYIWRSILAAKQIIRAGCRVHIGDGRATVIWNKAWLPAEDNEYVTTEKHVGLEHATVSDLMVTDSREWDIDIISDLFNTQDRELILRIHLSTNLTEDCGIGYMTNEAIFQ